MKDGLSWKYSPDYGPVVTDLIGNSLWDTESETWVEVRAMWYDSVVGMSFLVEDNNWHLLEMSYSHLSTKELKEPVE